VTNSVLKPYTPVTRSRKLETEKYNKLRYQYFWRGGQFIPTVLPAQKAMVEYMLTGIPVGYPRWS
jgi:hypothetical protein